MSVNIQVHLAGEEINYPKQVKQEVMLSAHCNNVINLTDSDTTSNESRC